MTSKSKSQKIFSILILILFLNNFFFLFITHVKAEGDEYLGQYEYKMYISGYTFTGTTERTLSETNLSLSTYFGTFQIVTIGSRSDFKLSTSGGYIEIINDKSYFDSSNNLRKSQSTWTIELSGYYPETWVAGYEYGDYFVLQDTPTTYEEMYTMRYYENGYFQESTSCRDLLTVDGTETIPVPAGSFACTRLKTMFYENSAYVGYAMDWVDDTGAVIKVLQYDEEGALMVEISLISKTPPMPSWVIPLIVVGGIFAFIIGIAVYFKHKKRNAPSSPEKTINPMFKTGYNSPTPYKSLSPSLYTTPGRACPLCLGTGIIKGGPGSYLCPVCKGRGYEIGS